MWWTRWMWPLSSCATPLINYLMDANGVSNSRVMAFDSHTIMCSDQYFDRVDCFRWCIIHSRGRGAIDNTSIHSVKWAEIEVWQSVPIQWASNPISNLFHFVALLFTDYISWIDDNPRIWLDFNDYSWLKSCWRVLSFCANVEPVTEKQFESINKNKMMNKKNDWNWFWFWSF